MPRLHTPRKERINVDFAWEIAGHACDAGLPLFGAPPRRDPRNDQLYREEGGRLRVLVTAVLIDLTISRPEIAVEMDVIEHTDRAWPMRRFCGPWMAEPRVTAGPALPPRPRNLPDGCSVSAEDIWPTSPAATGIILPVGARLALTARTVAPGCYTGIAFIHLRYIFLHEREA